MIKWQGKDAELEKNGVYGIYADDKLLYIGSTKVSFKDRLSGHNTNIKTKTTKEMYSYLAYNERKKTLTMRPLLIFDYLATNKPIDKQARGWMELALISVFRPRFNKAGRDRNYIFPAS